MGNVQIWVNHTHIGPFFRCGKFREPLVIGLQSLWACLISFLKRSSLFRYHPAPLPMQSPEAVSAVGKLSYNQLVEKIITCKHSSDTNLVTEGDTPAFSSVDLMWRAGGLLLCVVCLLPPTPPRISAPRETEQGTVCCIQYLEQRLAQGSVTACWVKKYSQAPRDSRRWDHP